MVTLHFQNLEVENVSGNNYRLKMNFIAGQFTQTDYRGQKNIRLMYKIYSGDTCKLRNGTPVGHVGGNECKGQLIDYLPQGFVSVPTSYNKSVDDDYFNSKRRSRVTSFVFPHFTTNSKSVMVQAYEVGAGQPRYVTGTATGDTEYEQTSNFAEETLTLIQGSIGSSFGRTKARESVLASAPQVVIRGTGFERGQAYQPPTEPAVVSGQLSFVTKKPESVFQPPVTLSPKIKKIIDDWSTKKIMVPAWFANNNMNWVLEGRITEQEFLDAYTNLVNTGSITFTIPQITIAPIPEITLPSIPEVSAVMELITTNFQVKLDNKIQFSSSLSNADYKRLQDEMSLEPKITLVFLNQTDFNPLSNFSKILRQIQNLLQGQVVETITISPTGQVITAPEPTVAPGKGLMGAGVLGVIGILMLGGFIADHMRKRK